MPNTKENSSASGEKAQLKIEIVNLKRDLAAKDLEIVRIKAATSQFIGMVAHELRNPLGVILSFSEFLFDETKDLLTGVQKHYINRIQNSTKFMLSLIADLIDISQIDAVKQTIDAEILDIVSLVSENIKLNQVLAAEKNITINFESSDAVVFLHGDANRLEQIFNNLFSNAIKFSEPGAAITVQLSKENENVYIRVTDSGMGIAVEDQDKIFIPFERIARKGTNGEKGTGLGLAIVKRIIEDHKGKICVESEPGKGSSFIVSLPLT